MKVINSLIAVEVPRGAVPIGVETVWSDYAIYYRLDENIYYSIIPFPAEIIGLASEIDAVDKVAVITSANAPVYTWESFLRSHSLTTTPTTDIIFLRKKL